MEELIEYVNWIEDCGPYSPSSFGLVDRCAQIVNPQFAMYSDRLGEEMFGLFKKSSREPSGAEMAENGLREIAKAIEQELISIQQGRLFNDIYVHSDLGGIRFSYVMFSPSIQNQVIARCAIIIDRFESGRPVCQIDWAVIPQSRGQGYGLAVSTKALVEFASGIRANPDFKNGYFIEAPVSQDNLASLAIANKLIGNEEIHFVKALGCNVHSFQRFIKPGETYAEIEEDEPDWISF